MKESADKDATIKERNVQRRNISGDCRLRSQVEPPIKVRKIQGYTEYYLSWSLNIWKVDFIEEFYDQFKDDLQTLWIVLNTKYDSSNSISTIKHVKAYLEFKIPIFPNTLKDKITSHYPNFIITMERCTLTKQSLEKRIKEFGDDSQLADQVFEWAQTTPIFHPTDKFVMENLDSKNYLQYAHATYHKHSFLLQPVDNALDNWTKKVCVWWNKCYNTFDRNQKSLYLWGDSHRGKKYVIRSIIKEKNFSFIFVPGEGKYFMEDYIPEIHKIILFDNFHYTKSIIGPLKCLLNRTILTFESKQKHIRAMVHKGPIIFISHFNRIKDEEIKDFLYFVHANTPFFDGSFTELKDVNSKDIHREIAVTLK